MIATPQAVRTTPSPSRILSKSLDNPTSEGKAGVRLIGVADGGIRLRGGMRQAKEA